MIPAARGFGTLMLTARPGNAPIPPVMTRLTG
jgi:hypothetical protein